MNLELFLVFVQNDAAINIQAMSIAVCINSCWNSSDKDSFRVILKLAYLSFSTLFFVFNGKCFGFPKLQNVHNNFFVWACQFL